MWVVAVLRAAPLGPAARENSGSASTASVRCVCAAAMLLVTAACAVDANLRCAKRWAWAASQVAADCARPTGTREVYRGLLDLPWLPLQTLARAGWPTFSTPCPRHPIGFRTAKGSQIPIAHGRDRCEGSPRATAHQKNRCKPRLCAPADRLHSPPPHISSELASRSLNTAEFQKKWPPRRRPRSQNRASSTL